MPPSAALRPRLRIVPARPLVVADVGMFYGERSGGIRTYLDEKVRWARRRADVEHHLLVPGPRERHVGTRHELPGLRVAASYGYRVPLGAGSLKAALSAIRPDVVVLHDPFWRPLHVIEHVHRLGAKVVAVHHGSSDLNAGAIPGPQALYRAGFRFWLKRAYAPVDALMSAADTSKDAGRPADLALRFGLHPAFAPQQGARRGDHVLYVGRLSREKGIDVLLAAAARSRESWPLQIVGTGTAGDHYAALVRRLGLERRVSLSPYVSSRQALARAYAEARCVVMPGSYETFGLVAFEAAASGARVVACETAPSARVIGPALCETYAMHDPDDLLRAVERQRERAPDLVAAQQLARRCSWEAAFAAELADLRALAAR